MSAHKSSPTPERRGGTPVAAVRRDENDPSPRRHDDEPRPTMNELLAACAAATAVSTPPDAPTAAESVAQPQADPRPRPSTGDRDAA